MLFSLCEGNGTHSSSSSQRTRSIVRAALLPSIDPGIRHIFLLIGSLTILQSLRMIKYSQWNLLRKICLSVHPNSSSQVLSPYIMRQKSQWNRIFCHRKLLDQTRLQDPGMETRDGFIQVGSQKEYQNVVIISVVHLEKISIFCFMHKGVAQKLSLPRPLEN